MVGPFADQSGKRPFPLPAPHRTGSLTIEVRQQTAGNPAEGQGSRSVASPAALKSIPHQYSCSWLASPCQLLPSELPQKHRGGRKAPRRGRVGGKNDNGEWLHSPHSCPKPPSHWALSTEITPGGEFLGSIQARGNELCL